MKRLGDLKTLSAYILILTAFSFINGCVSMTPLSTAAKSGDINAVKDFMAKGSNACEKGEYGLTPYMWAFEGGYTCRSEIYRILIDNAYEVL
ncbi:MAG: ankyrin repeat domain-containing protein [Nitrospinae bacterium]|nr:ankyrin repeat domain-containing protein [Nitrospinota bacterium]